MYSSAALSLLLASSASASTSLRGLVQSRRLSYEKIAGYQPKSQITDHAAIDLDQAAIETLLADGTDQSFAGAQSIYLQGGNSKSFATITLSTPLIGSVAKGAEVVGKDTTGAEVRGKMYESYDAGSTAIKIQYQTSDIQDSYVGCQEGALPASAQQTSGCFTAAANATLSISGVDYPYDGYSVATDNNNGRTIAGFSTSAFKKMYQGCKGCPYAEYTKYYDYYGQYDYAHQWVTAAFDGTSTSFKNGNANFASYGFTGRTGEWIDVSFAFLLGTPF